MKELTEHEKQIRDKDTKDLTLSGLKEKIRVVDKEVTLFDKELLLLAKQTHEVYDKRKKRAGYASVLRGDYNFRCMEIKKK